MASTSAPPRGGDPYGRFKTAASTLSSDNQSLVVEIRKALTMMKEVAVDLEKDNQSEMVKELEATVLQLLEASNDCTHLSAAIQSIGNSYTPDPKNQKTDFKKVLDGEISKSKASSSAPENNSLLRQFREAVWNVHHSGQPMPGEELEDIVMTSTQCSLRNINCPLTLKPLIELADPVRRYNQSLCMSGIFPNRPYASRDNNKKECEFLNILDTISYLLLQRMVLIHINFISREMLIIHITHCTHTGVDSPGPFESRCKHCQDVNFPRQDVARGFELLT